MVYYDTTSRRPPIQRGAPSSIAFASERELAVSEIAAPFAVSLPAVIKHLDVLARPT
jgi:hypothetical protein